MKRFIAIVLTFVVVSSTAAEDIRRDIPYAEPAHERQVLDVYAPTGATNLPVFFWIHGGGWQGGDKSGVQMKPQLLMDKGFVFVAPNYRLLPDVDMDVLVRDVARALGWVHRNISGHGGDARRIVVGGHSAGAQLAALLCTDARYLQAEGVPFAALKGCVPVDGDTYDIPRIIATAEFRALLYGQQLPTFGHRQKFGNDPRSHVDFSAVTHVARGRGIPPFLILHVSGHPDTTAQARRLGEALQAAEVPATVFAATDTTHGRINADLGRADDPATAELHAFLDAVLKK